MKNQTPLVTGLSFVLYAIFIPLHSPLPVLSEPPEVHPKLSLKEALHSITRTNPRKEKLAPILNQCKVDPAFRRKMVDGLTKIIQERRIRIIVSNAARALRDLDAKETLPLLRQCWNETEKKTRNLEHGELRIQLLLTLAQFLPDADKIRFLIETDKDPQEAPIVRFRATILLCATGNPQAIQHVLTTYRQAQKKYPRTTTMSIANQPNIPVSAKNDAEKRRHSRRTLWDPDWDLMSSYLEQGLFLAPDNRDTDGDGIVDGNDRNPLCAPTKEALSEDQQIAQFILYLHTRYYTLSRSPFHFNLWAIRRIDTYDSKKNPSLLANTEGTGINGRLLHVSPEQARQVRALHGNGISILNIHRDADSQPDIREFRLTTTLGPGEYRSYKISLKRFQDIWLPIEWKLWVIT
jgi:hypothetical protein